MSNSDIGYWTGSISYFPGWAQTPFVVNMGATDTNGVDWLWMSIQGWDSPPVVGTVVQRASDHGGWATEQYFTPRTLTLTVHASAPTQAIRDIARATLQQVLPVNDLATLVYNEPIPKQTQFRRAGQITETYPTLTDVEFQCVLVSPDPRKYSAVQKNMSAKISQDPTHTGLTLPFVLNTNLTPPANVGTGNVNGTTAVVTVGTAVPKGNGIVVVFSTGNASAQTVTATDTKGNIYTSQTLIQNATSPFSTLCVLTAQATTALTTSDTISVIASRSEFIDVAIYQAPGFITVDTVNSAQGNSAVPAVSSTAPGNASSYTFAIFANNATETASTPATWTALTGATFSTVHIDTFYKLNTTTSSVTATSSFTSTPWTAIALVVDMNPSSTLPPQPPSGSVTCFNAGNFETRPIVTIQGPINFPSVIDMQTGKFVSFSYVNLGVGDRLVIDTDARIGTLNGSYRAADLNSWWWVLQPGSHTLLLAGSTTGGASMTITYNDAWI